MKFQNPFSNLGKSGEINIFEKFREFHYKLWKIIRQFRYGINLLFFYNFSNKNRPRLRRSHTLMIFFKRWLATSAPGYWNMIKEFITNTTNKFIPSKTTPNKKHLPWVSKQIRAKIRRKDKFHKLAKQIGNPRLFDKWKAIRAEIKSDIKNSTRWIRQ